jgi:hypothetical protein
MRIFTLQIRLPGIADISGIKELDKQLQKFKDLRDSYYRANREYYGEYLATLLDGQN